MALRSAGSESYAFLLKPNSAVVPGSCQPGIVVVAGGVVQAELHVVVRTDPLAGVDGAAFQRRVDLAARRQDDRAARRGHDLAAEAGDAHLEALVVGGGVDLLAEPPHHLHARRGPRPRHEAERRVGFFPELEAIAVEVPGHHPVRVEAERHRREPLESRVLARPVVRRAGEHLDGALRARVEAAEGRHELAAGEHLNLQPTAAHVVDDLRHFLSRALEDVQRRRPRRGHTPLELGLGDHVRRVGQRRCRGPRRHRGLHEECASLHCVPPGRRLNGWSTPRVAPALMNQQLPARPGVLS